MLNPGWFWSRSGFGSPSRLLNQVFVFSASLRYVMEHAAVELVRARLGDERDLRRAAAGAFRALRRGRERDLLDRVETRPDDGEEAVGRLQRVVLDVDAVERHVDRALRQAVDDRVARPARRRDARQEDDEVRRVAARERQVRDLPRVERRRHRRRLGLDELGVRLHRDLFGQAADLERRADTRRHAGIDDDVVQDDRLEALQRHRHGVGAGDQRRHREHAARRTTRC